jgi:hypothetical protein
MIRHTEGTTTYTGAHITMFQAMVLRTGLKMYARTKTQPNALFTPANMLDAASRITGRKYRRGQYMEAANDLSVFIAIMECKS